MQHVNVTSTQWQSILDLKSGLCSSTDHAANCDQTTAIYGPLAQPSDRPFVIAQIGQSLDGRIASETGDAQDVSGQDGLAHLHRLRALADVVVIGVKTAIHDDPQLSVRLTPGQSPARVVIDPDGRLPNTARLLQDPTVRRIVIQSTPKTRPAGVETVTLPKSDWISPAAIISTLTDMGFRRILIEGGGITIAQFLEAGLLDRLHVAIAPLLIGSGPQSFTTSPIGTLAAALRPKMQAYNLGTDVLFDCAFAPAHQAAQHPTHNAMAEDTAE